MMTSRAGSVHHAPVPNNSCWDHLVSIATSDTYTITRNKLMIRNPVLIRTKKIQGFQVPRLCSATCESKSGSTHHASALPRHIAQAPAVPNGAAPVSRQQRGEVHRRRCQSVWLHLLLPGTTSGMHG